MAKSKSTAPSRKYEGPDFWALQNEMLDQVNTLNCAWHALQASLVVDGDETASKARNVVISVEKNLQRLLDDLERWEMHTRHTPQPKEVAHG